MRLPDPRTILEVPRGFRLFKRVIASEEGRRAWVDRHVRARPGDRVLDIGCGFGDIVEVLPEVDYRGFDQSAAYIARARQLFGDRGRFECDTVGAFSLGELAGTCQLVIANGVLHHLDDDNARALVNTARAALAPGGRLVTKDPCFTGDQSRLSRFLVSLDRGRHVRPQEQYLELLGARFERIEPVVYHHLLRIPYTTLIVESSVA